MPSAPNPHPSLHDYFLISRMDAFLYLNSRRFHSGLKDFIPVIWSKVYMGSRVVPGNETRSSTARVRLRMKLVFHTAGVSFAPSGKGSCLDPYFTKVAPARGVRFSLKSREGCHVFAGQKPTSRLLENIRRQVRGHCKSSCSSLVETSLCASIKTASHQKSQRSSPSKGGDG